MENMEEEDGDKVLDDILYSHFLTLRRQLAFSEDIDASEAADDIQSVFDEIKGELLIEQASQDSGDLFYENMAQTQFSDPVICPICQKNNLTKTNSTTISCACGVKIFGRSSIELDHIRHSLSTATNLHSTSCDQVPLFSLESTDDYSELSMQCNGCTFFYRIV